MYATKKESGFALLLTVVVVGVVLSVGLTILDLSVKQVRLSTNAKDSELAFQAANAGMECARYWRREESDEMLVGNAITPTCFGETTDTNTRDEITDGVSGDGQVFRYQYSFTWGASSEVRCTEITTLVASSTILGSNLTIDSAEMLSLVPGYPGGTDKVCEAGSQCSVISVRGYNRPCNTTGGYGVVQREVLLQF